MKIGANSPCPCGSQVKYKKCCRIYHLGTRASSALLLMKSRYSAFATNNYKYIMQTTHSQNQDFTQDTQKWKLSIESFCQSTEFNKLDILDFETTDTEAYVTFKATLSQEGADCSFSEKSRFFKVDNQWLYHSGVFLDE